METQHDPHQAPSEPPETWRKDSQMYTTRRKSVVAEKFDPEKEDLHDLKIYPKTDAQRERLRSVLQRIVLFRALDSEQMARVLDCMFEESVKAGTVIIRKGDEGDNFYVIESGEFGVTLDSLAELRSSEEDDDPDSPAPKPKTTIVLSPEQLQAKQMKFANILKNEGFFGELALMYNVPRSATVISLTPGVVWVMGRHSFRSVVLHAAYHKRHQYEKLISRMPVLTPLDDYDRMRLADALVDRRFPPREPIFTAGDSADGMYFLVKGKVRITLGTRGSSGEHEIRVQEPGSYFGEAALLHEGSRTANVYAADEPVECAFVDKQSFERLLGPCTDLLQTNMSTYKFES